jgi:carbon monoxide dehydrogenase subunit G
MTTIESDRLYLNRKVSEVFDYLMNAGNYEKLMPSNVTSFETDGTTVHLTVQGLGRLSLAITESLPNEWVKIEPVSKTPFFFFIQWNVSASGANTSVICRVEADLNVMMKIMAQRLLKDLINTQVHNLKTQIEAS